MGKRITRDMIARARDIAIPSPESYVMQWDARGRIQGLYAWELPYQSAGHIESARRMGLIRISGNVACDITIEPLGERLIRRAWEAC